MYCAYPTNEAYICHFPCEVHGTTSVQKQEQDDYHDVFYHLSQNFIDDIFEGRANLEIEVSDREFRELWLSITQQRTSRCEHIYGVGSSQHTAAFKVLLRAASLELQDQVNDIASIVKANPTLKVLWDNRARIRELADTWEARIGDFASPARDFLKDYTYDWLEQVNPGATQVNITQPFTEPGFIPPRDMPDVYWRNRRAADLRAEQRRMEGNYADTPDTMSVSDVGPAAEEVFGMRLVLRDMRGPGPLNPDQPVRWGHEPRVRSLDDDWEDEGEEGQ